MRPCVTCTCVDWALPLGLPESSSMQTALSNPVISTASSTSRWRRRKMQKLACRSRRFFVPLLFWDFFFSTECLLAIHDSYPCERKKIRWWYQARSILQHCCHVNLCDASQSRLFLIEVGRDGGKARGRTLHALSLLFPHRLGENFGSDFRAGNDFLEHIFFSWHVGQHVFWPCLACGRMGLRNIPMVCDSLDGLLSMSSEKMHGNRMGGPGCLLSSVTHPSEHGES